MLILTAVCIGTFIQLDEGSSFASKFFQCFSLKRNYMNFIKNDSSMPYLDGIKGISVVAIFVHHSIWTTTLVFPFRDGKILNELIEKYISVASSPIIYLEAFFLVSGILSANSLMRGYTLWKFYFQRYMRMTPILVMLMLSSFTIGRDRKGFAPYQFQHFFEDCRNYWWSDLLHIQNYLNPKNMVNTHNI